MKSDSYIPLKQTRVRFFATWLVGDVDWRGDMDIYIDLVLEKR